MKIAILADTHFGARNDSQLFLDYFTNFFENTFFPECEKRGVKTIIHLGDLMDRRKFVNFNTLSQVREKFVEPIKVIPDPSNPFGKDHINYFSSRPDYKVISWSK